MTSEADRRCTGLILAGGRARRMGGEDKGLLKLAGRPMVAHVIERLRPQVDALLINANRNLEAYEALGAPVVPDRLPDFGGPLAGMDAGLAAARTGYLVVVPCDSPYLPADLVARLREALESAGAELAVAHDGERAHPVFCLLRTMLGASLERALAEGERKIDRWYARHRVVEADFSDQPQAFANVNTPEDRARLAGAGTARQEGER